MGTYDDEDPNAGVAEKVANSIRKIVGNTATGTPPVGTGGKQREQAIDDAVTNAQTGQHSDEYLSTRRAGQSTDKLNTYNY